MGYSSSQRVGRCTGNANQGKDRTYRPPHLWNTEAYLMTFFQNLIQGELVNGSIGKVVAFESPGEAVKEGLDIASIQREMTNNSGTQSDTVTKKPDDIPLNILARQDTWPVVKFTSGRTCLCIPTSFEIKNGNDLLKAQRDQVRSLICMLFAEISITRTRSH